MYRRSGKGLVEYALVGAQISAFIALVGSLAKPSIEQGYQTVKEAITLEVPGREARYQLPLANIDAVCEGDISCEENFVSETGIQLNPDAPQLSLQRGDHDAYTILKVDGERKLKRPGRVALTEMVEGL